MSDLKLNTDAECVVICDDSRRALKAFENKADLIITSPPYADARRSHYDSVAPDDFCDWFMTFHEPLYNALKPTGSLVINIKDKVVDGVRHRYVWHTIEALIKKGWYSIDDYIWHKKNSMPGYWPARLRDAWEYCFHLAKCTRPYFNAYAVAQPASKATELRLKKLGKNDLTLRSSSSGSNFKYNVSKWLNRKMVLPNNVMHLAAVTRNMGHPAAYPVALPSFFIKLLSPQSGLVIDPFAGSGTTGIAARSVGRKCVLIDNNQAYCDTAIKLLQCTANQ